LLTWGSGARKLVQIGAAAHSSPVWPLLLAQKLWAESPGRNSFPGDPVCHKHELHAVYRTIYDDVL